MTQYVGLDVSIIETKLHVVDEAEPGESGAVSRITQPSGTATGVSR